MEKHGVIRSAGMVGGLTLVSRGMGFVRDILMAQMFGTGAAASAFATAFRLPNLFRALFGEGALSAAFIPVFVETRQQEGDAVAWRIARQVFTLVALVLAGLVLVGVAAATWALSFQGLSPFQSLVWSLFRIMFPYMFFICLTAVSMGVLNSFHHFALPAATPWILNAVQIAILLWVCPRLGLTQEERIYGVAWGVILAGVLQLGIQLPVLMRHGFEPKPLWHLHDKRLLRMLVLMGPVAVGRAVTQVNVMVDSMLALWIGTWAPAALFYSERLIYLPLGIFATALGTVLLPLFSGQAARGDHAALRDSVNHSLRLLMFVMVPAAVGMWVLAEPICHCGFQRGSFTAESTMLTVRALEFYAPGMIVFSLGKVFVPAFYGMQDAKTPVRVGVATVLLNIALSVTFMLTWPLYYKHAGIVCATVIAETLNAVAMGWIVHRRLGSPGWASIAASLGRTALAAALMAGVAYAANRLALHALGGDTAGLGARIVALGTAIGAGLAVYAGAAALMRSPELADLLASARRRRRA